MQEELLSAPEKSGATALRGARGLGIDRKGSRLKIEARINGENVHLRSDFVVIADGRNSAVRKRAGFEMTQGRPGRMIAGALLGNCGVPE